jgi:hypothetical protein
MNTLYSQSKSTDYITLENEDKTCTNSIVFLRKDVPRHKVFLYVNLNFNSLPKLPQEQC